MALDFFAGCVGGCAGVMVGYPLDTVKVHMQTQDNRNPKYRGTWHCFRTILIKESVTGLYRGMSSPMAGVAAVNAIVFGVYGQTQRNLTEPNHLSSHFLAGACAGLAQTPICSPIELAKTRLQLQSPDQQKFRGPLECLKDIYKREGYRGVFRGFGITLLRETPSYGVYFLTYERLMRPSGKEPISTPYMLFAGGLAGTASWVISYPLDVVKSRLQADCKNRYSGALDCLKKSVRTEGYSCLYRGLSSTIIRAFPTNAATFAAVTWTFRIFDYESNQLAGEEDQSKIVQPIRRMSSDQESLLNRWNNFLESVSQEKILQRSYYSVSSTMLADGLMFDNPSQNYRCSKMASKYNVLGSKFSERKAKELKSEEDSNIDILG